MAVVPPTLAPVPARALRTASTVSSAAWLSGADFSVPSNSTSPFFTTGSPTVLIPGTAANAARTGSCRSAAAITTTGSPWPAGKCRPSTSSPATEGCSLVNESFWLSPLASSWTRPSAITPSAAAVPIQTTRGRRAIRAPIRAHMPVAVGSGVP